MSDKFEQYRAKTFNSYASHLNTDVVSAREGWDACKAEVIKILEKSNQENGPTFIITKAILEIEKL